MKNPHIPALIGLLAGLSLAGCSMFDNNKSDSSGVSQTSSTGSEVNYSSTDSATYMRSTSAGNVLTTPDGMTVYTYDKDSSGASSCYGECADHWPPVLAATDAQASGSMTIVERNDGTRQWAYNGMPLYLYHDDTAPGIVEGDNVGGVWHVVK